jgi:predicted nucleotidyltransferase
MVSTALDRVREMARAEPRLALLVLYGSRARGDAHATSDWDFGYLAEEGFDPSAFLAALVRTVECDEVDLVDLGRASGQLRYRAAAEGLVVHGRPAVFEAFWFDAVSYWCDMQGVIRAEYARVLEGLSP